MSGRRLTRMISLIIHGLMNLDRVTVDDVFTVANLLTVSHVKVTKLQPWEGRYAYKHDSVTYGSGLAKTKVRK